MISKEYRIKYIDKTGHICATSIHAATLKEAINDFNLHDTSDDAQEIIGAEFIKINNISDKEMNQINAFLLSTKNGLTEQ